MRAIFQATLTVGLLILSAQNAYSCTCLQITHRKEFRQSDAVFAGTVIDVTEDTSYVPPKLKVSSALQNIIDSTKRFVVRFKVEKKFKGVKGQEVRVYAFQSDSGCSGMVFGIGKSYLVYADRTEESLTGGNLCSRTRKMDRSSKEYKELNSFWFRLSSRVRWRATNFLIPSNPSLFHV